MKVQLIARTVFDADLFEHETGLQRVAGVADADALAEAAGRQCYAAFGRTNPATATNRGYLANILDHQHYSVLEHATATFLVQGVSRSLLTELNTHRFVSRSVESQRYVDQSGREPVIPPALRGTDCEEELQVFHAQAEEVYQQVRKVLTEQGLPRKQANEAARAFLLNAQPVDMVVTANMRAWREVLSKRHHIAADMEIQELARELLSWLKRIAPNTFQDMSLDPVTNDVVRRAST